VANGGDVGIDGSSLAMVGKHDFLASRFRVINEGEFIIGKKSTQYIIIKGVHRLAYNLAFFFFLPFQDLDSDMSAPLQWASPALGSFSLRP
jgi:hypothetical protein